MHPCAQIEYPSATGGICLAVLVSVKLLGTSYKTLGISSEMPLY